MLIEVLVEWQRRCVFLQLRRSFFDLDDFEFSKENEGALFANSPRCIETQLSDLFRIHLTI